MQFGCFADWLLPIMRRSLAFVVSFLLVTLPMLAQTADPAAAHEPLVIELTPLGDAGDGVVFRTVFRYSLPSEVPDGGGAVIQGSFLQDGKSVKNFRLILRPDERSRTEIIERLPQGNIAVEARLFIPLDDLSPLILARGQSTATITPTGTNYEPAAEDGAAGIVAEGLVGELEGSVRILPPRRDLAMNLFRVDVEASAPVSRVEFWVDGKRILARNTSPFRAELDLGVLPHRVEVKAIGFDRTGRYLDADVWLVSERENRVELKLTRTVAKGVSHFKANLQNRHGIDVGPIELFADDRKLATWHKPPYSFSIPDSALDGTQFVRATTMTSTGDELTDLIFLDGSRMLEHVDVQVVELPVLVTDASGRVVTDLKADDFEVIDSGRRQKVAGFSFAGDTNLTVGVIVDHSGSMKPQIDDARQAALGFFNSILRPGDRAFFGGFAWEATSISPLVADIASLQRQVASMPDASGGTALYDAIVTSLYRFRGVEGRKALIVVSDGEDTVSRVAYNDMLTYLRASRVPVYFIGIGMSGIGAGSRLRTLAAETGGVAHFVRNADQLEPIYRALEAELRSQYLISYYPDGTEKGYRTVEVRLPDKKLKVRTARGYIP
jgi:Ca-activated chloride channel homolog